MNVTQRKHVLARLQSAYNKHESIIRNKFTTHAISEKEFIDLVNEGKIKLKKLDSNFHFYNNAVGLFDTTGYCMRTKIDEAKAKPHLDKLYQDYLTMQDKVVLLKEEDVVKAMEEFDKKQYA